MGDLAKDAAVRGSDGRFTAELSPEWGAWGPNGGFVAAVLRNAALAHGDLPRVASMTCHFLSVGAFAPVEVEATTLRRARRAQSVRVAMRQDGRAIAEALVWLVADDLDGLEHDVARLNGVPGPEGLPYREELDTEQADDPDTAPETSMWANIQSKPVAWVTDWRNATPREPYASGWYRFPSHTTGDAARQLILLDVMAWSAAWSAHLTDLDYTAPNLDLTVQFHRSAVKDEWLFAEGFADVAEDGLIGFRSRVWSGGRNLLASGSGQLLCRPPRS
ncbi:thioesterase family protein [Actinomadura barringtoniae]|uniref:Thioesterase family protein n=1 Tax=Actinomadura barringtoniae TaxID=1427535 RepID=A0A939T3H4_9ACTN|nr:thioesterase family protein [Actinomadura barringtoniae]MBO2451161.1 thioesterase family protein [Actinomadura barringtoniae]